MKKAVIVLLSMLQFAWAQSAALRGYNASAEQDEREWERKFQGLPEAGRIRAYADRMARAPHHAGSAEGRAVAEYARDLFKSWGYDAEIESFDVLLPYPTTRVLELLAPVRYNAQLKEPPIAEDPNSSDAGQLPTYNAYSASADVTAPLVYANYGVPEDYDELARHGIDVRGKIVITRYGKSWRGVKPKVAQEHGAAGCLIYSDPREDGYFAGDVYPRGAYRPAQGVQRGSVVDMAIYPGDPLTPGYASDKGAKRLSRAEAKTIMKIPVLPISYGDAQPLLAQLTGTVVPESWRGALPITYHFGGNNDTKAHLKLDFDWSTRPIYDVIATMPGTQVPDQWILYGNHHDAWVNGANDPISGAAALLETARALSVLKQQGWQPKRTIKFALWDAEEFGLIGSTEWAEKHADELTAKAVVYFNSDSNGRGRLGASGSPMLEPFVAGVMADVRDPGTGTTLAQVSTRPRDSSGEGGGSGEFHLGALGAGSDYVVFAHRLGISSLNLGFGGADSGGVYHSIYDSPTWYNKFSDSDRIYGRALSQVFGTSMLRLADAPVLPVQFVALGRTVRSYVDEIEKEAERSGHHLVLAPLQSELEKLDRAAQAYEQNLPALTSSATSLPPDRLAMLNQLLFQTERGLLLPEGLPGRDWYRSQLVAPGLYTGYGAKTLPGIREAVEAGRFAEANEQAQAVARMLRNVTARIEAINGQTRTLGTK